MGVDGVWYSVPLADLTATIVTAVILFYNIRRFKAQDKALANTETNI